MAGGISTLLGGVAIGAIIAGGTASAQAPAPAVPPDTAAPPANALQEVVVTAQRRAERLQDVPVAITALDSRQLASRQILDARDLAAAAPSVSFAQGEGDPTDIVLGIRGLAITQAQLTVDPAVGVYIDGVYLSRTSGANAGFVDMQQVEVLRGPQGTLFGRNTIGGALNITTNAPTSKFEGLVSADFGNYDSRDFTGILNLPVIGDKIDVRLVYQHVEHSGYAHDDYLNVDQNDLYQDYGRLSVRVRPTAGWELLVTSDLMHATGDSQASKVDYVDPSSPFNAVVPAVQGHPGDLIGNYVGKGGFYTTYSDIDPRLNLKTSSTTATLTGHLGSGVTVKSITGYRWEDVARGLDFDGTPYVLLQTPVNYLNYDQVSQELQLLGDGFGGRLQWIFGGYYFRESGHQGQVTELLGGLTPAYPRSQYEATNQSDGAFVQATYEILPKVRLTAGIRYTDDSRSIRYLDQDVDPATGALSCGLAPQLLDNSGACQSQEYHADFSYLPFTVGLDYKPVRDVLLYAKVSRGFRSGGFEQDATNAAQTAPFAPEDLLSPEGGFKLEVLDRRLRLNGAVYYSFYDNIQQSFNAIGSNGTPITITANVGDAHLYGGELEGDALLGRLRVHAGLGLVEPTFTQGPEVGLPFTNVSRLTYSVGANYPIEFSAGSLQISSDYVYRSREYFFEPYPGNPAASAANTQDGYGLWNARLDFTLAAEPVTLSLYGRNLSNQVYKARDTDFYSGGAGFGFIQELLGDPRTYGFAVTYKF